VAEPEPETKPPESSPAALPEKAHEAAPRHMSRSARAILALVALGIALPACAFAAIMMPGPLAEKKIVVVPHGTSAAEIAALLESNGVVISPLLFRAASRLLPGGTLQAGEYEFTPGQSIADVVLTLREGHSIVRLFTVAEGLSSAEIADLLRDNPVLTGDIAKPPAEGSLLPESYRYSYGDGRASVIARMQKSMQDTLKELWPQRDASVPLKSPAEAVVMASIIEKETGKPEERPRIAEVFYNRLRQSMRLQSDPTVIYALTQGKRSLDRALTRDDLMFPSPFNTYTSDGLPPAPICNPGRASLAAALHPAQGDDLYFVADGTGGHVFAKDLAAHNQNVAKWDRLKASASAPLPPLPPVKPASH
jgi:UPF0755 protein